MTEDVKAAPVPSSDGEVNVEQAPASDIAHRPTVAGASTYLNDLLKGMIAKNHALKTSKVQRRD
jgi:hypothetical protein